MLSHSQVAEPSNHEWLVGRFADRIRPLCPSSILDVGCGSGLLLRTLSLSGAECQGLDQPGPRLESLRDEGYRVLEGSAYDLPFAAGEMEWVTMRHIPHHLEDPRRAFAEALRVASRGVLLAEPWFDLSLPSQMAALEYDRLEKALDRQGGRYHAESMLLSDLLEALPPQAIDSLHVESHTD
ncbi:MAG: class I SAM-dependent methyltransferase, partial [Planctomycetota bacterium]